MSPTRLTVPCEARCCDAELVVVVRHGEPVSYCDGGLTPNGRHQIELCGAALAGQLHFSVKQRSSFERPARVVTWTSPSRRCRETASTLVAVLRDEGFLARRARVRWELAPVQVRTPSGMVDLAAVIPEVEEGPAAGDLERFWEKHRSGENPFALWEVGEFPSFEPLASVQARLEALDSDVASPESSGTDAGCRVRVLVTHCENIRLLEQSWGLADPPGAALGEARLYRSGCRAERCGRALWTSKMQGGSDSGEEART